MRTTLKKTLIQKAGAIFVFGLTILGPSLLFSQPHIAWIQRYNGPGNGNDSPVKLVADQDGNIYIAGTVLGNGTGYDIGILKYDSKGNLLWERTYNGLANGNDACRTIGLDGNGNVYVLGIGPGLNSSSDFTVLKYDSLGNQIFVERYSFTTPVIFDDFTVNSTGNSYLIGSFYVGGLNNWDWLMLHYSPQGQTGGLTLIDSGPGSWDECRDIVISDDGTIYASGGNLYGAQILRKFGQSGAWSVSTTVPSQSLTIDSRKNIYFEGIYVLGDFVTKKYDSSGTLLWTRVYNGPANGSERFSEMVVDAVGNLYVTGLSPGVGTGNDYATVKYDSTGNEVWVRRYDGPTSRDDIPFGIAVGGENIYVTGGSYADYATIKYDSAGNQIWVHRYNGPRNSSDGAYDIVANEDGHVWVTGGSAGDILTIKYSPTPILKGDLDENGVLALDDIVSLLNCVFLGSGSCPPAFADVNCDAFLSPADVVVLLLTFFASATPPC